MVFLPLGLESCHSIVNSLLLCGLLVCFPLRLAFVDSFGNLVTQLTAHSLEHLQGQFIAVLGDFVVLCELWKKDSCYFVKRSVAKVVYSSLSL